MALYDVFAVNIKSKAERKIAENQSERDAEAIVSIAVLRLGVDDEYFIARKQGEDKEFNGKY